MVQTNKEVRGETVTFSYVCIKTDKRNDRSYALPNSEPAPYKQGGTVLGPSSLEEPNIGKHRALPYE